MTTAYFAGPVDEPDRYQLTELRSRGGEGELWVGWINAGGQQLPVAVKVFHPSSGLPVDQLAARVRGQAEILRSLEHPNLVKVRESFLGPAIHEAGAAQGAAGVLYLVMNWAPGESLEGWVARNPQRDPLQCSRIVSRLAAGIDELHSGRATSGVAVLHRDIKPANVMVNGEEVRLVDFGLARFASGEFNTIAGTPAYLAPEVMAGAPPTEASDRFGLGGVAYFLFAGASPDLTNPAAMRAALHGVPGITDKDGFAHHLLAMLNPDPARRPTDVVAWAQGLAIGTVSQSFSGAVTTAAPPATGPAFAGPRGAGGAGGPGGGAPRRGGGRKALIGVLAAVVLIAAGVVAFVLSSGGDDDVASGSSTTTTSSSSSTSSSTTSSSTSTTVPGSSTTLPESPGGIDAPNTIQHLADFSPVDRNGSYSNGQGALSGTIYTRSVMMAPGYDTAFFEYNLGRKYARFDGKLGLLDNVKADALMKVEIYADGVVIFDHTVKLGDVVPVDLDVTNVLRLRLQVTNLRQNYGYDNAILADPRLHPAT